MNAAPIVVTALFGSEDFARLDALRRRHYPVARNRVPAHLTLFRQIAPSLAGELAKRLSAATRHRARPAAWLIGVDALKHGVAFRVASEELEAIRADLAEAFIGSLMPHDATPWRPHITIQNKAEPLEARRLHAELSAGFARCPLVIAGLATWSYRDGGWEARSRHMFA